MKYKLFRLAALFTLCLGVLGPALPASAAGASISLVANKSTVTNGGSLIVAVYMNGGGTAVNGIEADLSYTASKLQYVGVNFSGSAFEIGAAASGGNGAVVISRGTISPISGSGLVATITFKALSDSGTASISVSGSSSLVDANTNAALAYGSSGANVKFGVVPSSGPSSAAVASAPPAPKDTTPPVITLVKASAITPFSATITWTTSETADSAVEYGLDMGYGLSFSATSPVTAHSLALTSSFLTPETVFHYRVKSVDGAGNVATSPDQTLQLRGVPVIVIVRGADGKPQIGASVTLDGSTGTTDSKGSVTLHSSLGNKKITTNYQGVTVQKPITVSRSVKPLPPYQLDLSQKPLNTWMVTSLGLLVLVLVLLGIDAVLFGSHFFARLAGIHFKPAPPHHDRPVAEPVGVERDAQVAAEPQLPQSIADKRPSTIQDVTSPAAFNSMTMTPVPSKQQITITDMPTAEVAPSAAIAPRLKKPAHRKHAKTANLTKPSE